MRLLTFGEVLWDVYPDNKYIGGAPFNFGAHAAKHGDDVYLVSAVGDDELGKETLACVEDYGLKSDFVAVVQGKETGKCLVELGENKVPEYTLLEDVAYDCIPEPKGRDFDVLYFGTLALRSEHNMDTVKKIIDKHICNSVFVDVNIRPPFYSEASVIFALKNADYIKISDEELGVVSRLALGIDTEDKYETVKKLVKKYTNLKLVILTMGEKGSYVYDCKTGTEYECGAKKVTPVSTVGAGDSFGASFISCLYKGMSIGKCLEVASCVSGFVVSCADAVPWYDINEIARI